MQQTVCCSASHFGGLLCFVTYINSQSVQDMMVVFDLVFSVRRVHVLTTHTHTHTCVAYFFSVLYRTENASASRIHMRPSVFSINECIITLACFARVLARFAMPR